MRVFRLFLLGLLAYVVSMLVLFPLSPIIDRLEPQIKPVSLAGVNGKVYRGKIDVVRYEDDLLPLEVSNVAWTLAPGTLLKGGAGAIISYDGYGGSGAGQVMRKWNGHLAVSNFNFDAIAKEFEPLLPIPGIATFTGTLTGDIRTLVLENQLLETFAGNFGWTDASINSDFFSAKLGNVSIEVEPNGEKQHIATLKASGGELDIDGSIDMAQNGDFSADVLITPTANASNQILNNLRRVARPESGGRYRYTQKGNLNRLM